MFFLPGGAILNSKPPQPTENASFYAAEIVGQPKPSAVDAKAELLFWQRLGVEPSLPQSMQCCVPIYFPSAARPPQFAPSGHWPVPTSAAWLNHSASGIALIPLPASVKANDPGAIRYAAPRPPTRLGFSSGLGGLGGISRKRRVDSLRNRRFHTCPNFRHQGIL